MFLIVWLVRYITGWLGRLQDGLISSLVAVCLVWLAGWLWRVGLCSITMRAFFPFPALLLTRKTWANRLALLPGPPSFLPPIAPSVPFPTFLTLIPLYLHLLPFSFTFPHFFYFSTSYPPLSISLSFLRLLHPSPNFTSLASLPLVLPPLPSLPSFLSFLPSRFLSAFSPSLLSLPPFTLFPLPLSSSLHPLSPSLPHPFPFPLFSSFLFYLCHFLPSFPPLIPPFFILSFHPLHPSSLLLLFSAHSSPTALYSPPVHYTSVRPSPLSISI